MACSASDRERETGHRPAKFERDVQMLKMVANLIGQTVRLHRSVTAERERLMQEKHRLQKALQVDTPGNLQPEERHRPQ